MSQKKKKVSGKTLRLAKKESGALSIKATEKLLKGIIKKALERTGHNLSIGSPN